MLDIDLEQAITYFMMLVMGYSLASSLAPGLMDLAITLGILAGMGYIFLKSDIMDKLGQDEIEYESARR